MKTINNIDLLEAARELGPILREHADVAERERRPAKAVMEALSEVGLQRMFVPESLGGLEIDPVTYARVAEEVAVSDSVAGWALQVGNHITWWCARLPKEGVNEIFSGDSPPLIAGAFHPPQPATAVEGGYRLTGRAPLASNIHDADWLLLSGIVMEGDQPRMNNGAPELTQMILRAEEAKIVDTWYALGMRGTDSNDVEVDDVFVPQSRTFPMAPEFQPGPDFQGPLYRFPGVGAIVTIFAPVALGIGRAAIEEFRDIALKKTPLGATKTVRYRNAAQATLAKAEAMLRSARSLFFETIGEAWEKTKAGEAVSLETKADLMLAGTHAANTAADVADMMHGLAGTSGIYERSRLERRFRDAKTLRHQGFVCATRYETAGQVYLEVEPEFPFVHF